MEVRLPIPQNWQDFENICHRLWTEIWNDPTAKKNGRQGQAQNGVDVYGKPVYSKMYSGVQCKDKNGQLGSELKEKELLTECRSAINFQPKLETFTLATTSVRDAAIQEQARTLSSKKRLPFSVDVWFWDDIQSEIIYRPAILDHFYKGFPFLEEGQTKIKLNRFSSKDQCAAFFSRPVVEQSLSSQLKTYLISLAYEINDNSFRHGQATEFNIAIDGNKVCFIDNGKEFNILQNLNPGKTSPAGYVGTFVLHEFLRKFNGYVHPNYRREQSNGMKKNVLEFEIAKEAGKMLQEDFVEIEVDQAGGREDAARLAATVPITDGLKEIIWNMTSGYGYALSFSTEFIRIILLRLNADQKLILYVPRNEMYLELKKWFPDERLIVRMR